MATISENLEALNEEKELQKIALENQGQDMTGVPYTQYHEKISAIKTKPNLTTKEITANGTYNASDDGVDGYSSVDVSVPQPSGTIEITENGTHNVADYESASVNVPQLTLGTTTITKSGVHYAKDDGVDGYSEVDVVVGEDLFVVAPSSFKNTRVQVIEVDSDNVLIGSQNAYGLYRYNVKTKETTSVGASGKFEYFKKIGNRIIAGGGDGDVVVYDIEQMKVVDSESGYAGAFIELEGVCIIGHIYSTAYKVLAYIEESGTLKDIGAQIACPKYGARIGNKVLIASNSTSTDNAGIWLYNMDTNTTSKAYTTGNGWQYFGVVGNKCFISSNQEGNGVLLYNSEDDSFTQISTANSITKFQAIANKVLFGRPGGSVVAYNMDDGTIAYVNTGGSYKGVWETFQVIGNKCLITNSNPDPSYSEPTVCVYNSEDGTCKSILKDGELFINFQVMGNKCLIGSSSERGKTESGGVLVYDYDTDKVVWYLSMSTYRGKYDKFKLDGDNCYIYSSNLAFNNLLAYYDASTSKVETVGAIVDR